jgi:hypothetical protein
MFDPIVPRGSLTWSKPMDPAAVVFRRDLPFTWFQTLVVIVT